MKKASMFLLLSFFCVITACHKSGVPPKPDLPPPNDPGKGGITGSIAPNVSSTVIALLEPTLDSISSTPTKTSGAFVLRNLPPGKYDLEVVPGTASYKVTKYSSLIISSGGYTDAGIIPLGQ